MMKNVFLFDITRHIGPVQSLMGSAQRYVSSWAPDRVEWFAFQDQALSSDLQPSSPNVVNTVSAAGEGLWTTIENRIRHLSGDGFAGATFHILSYDGSLLRAADRLAMKREFHIIARSLGIVKKAARAERLVTTRLAAAPVQSLPVTTGVAELDRGHCVRGCSCWLA